MKEFFNYFVKHLFSATITVLSLIILIITYYKSEIVFDGNLREYYFQYFVFFLLIFTLSIITFFLNFEVKKNILIVFCSVILVLYTLEITLYFYGSYKEKKNAEKISNFYEDKKNFDKRTRLEVYEELKKANDPHVISLSPHNYINDDLDIFPLSGISNSSTIFCNENGYYSIYLSDRFGFNNDDNNWNKEIIDFLIVGDSFAQGACVNRPNDITSILKILSGKNIINIGYGGNGPLKDYAALREYLDVRKVKNIIWLFYSNDINDLNSEIKNKILKKYLDDKKFSQNLSSKQNIIDELAYKKLNSLKIKKEKKMDLDFYGFFKLNNLRSLIHFKNNKNFKQIENILYLSKELIEQRNGNFYFIYLPSFEEINSKQISSDKESINEIVEKLKIKSVNIYDFINKKKNSLDFFPYQRHGHYSEFGYKQISLKIFDDLF